jgi:putative phage-type endonuclease
MTRQESAMLELEKAPEIPGVLVERYQTEEEWARARMTGLGGSDIAAVLGLSPFRDHNRMSVYLSKVGLADEVPESDAMYWGREQETLIAKRFAQDTGECLIHPQNCLYRSAKVPWMIGTPDRLLYGKKEGLEIKTASYAFRSLWGEPGSDEIPEYYLTQCVWYMALTGYERWHVAVLIGGNDYRTYVVEKDPELESILIEQARAFWEYCVLAENPPKLDGSESTKTYLRKRYPKDDGEMKLATVEINAMAEELAALNIEIAEREQRVAEIKALMQDYIGQASGVKGMGWKATWKKTKDSTVVNWEAVAKALNPPAALIEQNTVIRPGSRRFLFTVEKTEKGV